MNGKQLRNSVLQLAISGKLVPQDPDDEPAIELLRRINPKATPLAPDNAPIPPGWTCCQIKDVCLFENGYAFNSHDYKEEGTPIIRISDIVDNKVELKKCVFYQGNVDERFSISRGDLLIALSGATTGKMGVYLSDKKAYLNQRVGNLKIIDTNVLLPDYRNIFMQSKVDEILKLAYGGAQPNISGKTISDFAIPLPPLAEQERIVRKLDELLPLVERYDKAQQALCDLNNGLKGKLRASILREAISGRLVPQDPNDEPAALLLRRINPKATPIPPDDVPFPIPDSWVWCKLSDYVKLVTDFVASGSFASLRENVKYYREENYAVLVRTLDLQNNFTKDLVYTDKHGYEFLSNSNLFGGELILPNIGASIGKVFLVPHLNKQMTLAPNSIMLRFHDEKHIAWFYFLFSSAFGQRLLKSITSSTAQAKFNKTGFRNLLIPLPPLAEQERIVAKIEAVFAVLDGLR